MTDQTEISESLAKRMGVEWHEEKLPKTKTEFHFFTCVCGFDSTWCCNLEEHITKHNLDYFTADGRQLLLEWCVEQEWWNSEDGFIDSLGDVEPFINSSGTTSGISLFIDHMLIPVTRFAREVYLYLEGIDDA